MSAAAPSTGPGPERGKTRLDQWLWFARFAKSRSIAARLCLAGAVTVNGATARKPNQTVRIGDLLVVPQGGWLRSVRVLALGTRRGPAAEARLLYLEETMAPRPDAGADWVPLLDPDAAPDWTPPPLT